MSNQTLVPYSDVRCEIRNADLLLFRRRNRVTRLIAVAGRSQYVHAAMAGWWKNRLMCVEMTSGGGRAQLLSNIVAQWPGVIDVYRANAAHRRFSRERALKTMLGITGRRYGWANLFRMPSSISRCCDSSPSPTLTISKPQPDRRSAPKP